MMLRLTIEFAGSTAELKVTLSRMEAPKNKGDPG
jgi:hypothetical protein